MLLPVLTFAGTVGNNTVKSYIYADMRLRGYMLNCLFVIYLLTGASLIYSQPALNAKDIKGSKKYSLRNFNGESLYGYIDGGADLYLEYGFSDVTVTEFLKAKSKYKVEIYRMKDADAAFGIFSVSRFRCLVRPAFTPFTCQNRYQLQVCKGRYYINIINDTGTPADTAFSSELARRLIPEINETDFDPADYFYETDPDTLKKYAFLVKGRLGIQNSVPETEKYLADAVNYKALIIREGNYINLSVHFESNRDYTDYLSKVTGGKLNFNGSEIMSVWNIPLKTTESNGLLFRIPAAGSDY